MYVFSKCFFLNYYLFAASTIRIGENSRKNLSLSVGSSSNSHSNRNVNQLLSNFDTKINRISSNTIEEIGSPSISTPSSILFPEFSTHTTRQKLRDTPVQIPLVQTSSTLSTIPIGFGAGFPHRMDIPPPVINQPPPMISAIGEQQLRKEQTPATTSSFNGILSAPSTPSTLPGFVETGAIIIIPDPDMILSFTM